MLPNENGIKVIAVIPCLNEEKFIASVVSKAAKHVHKVLVIDDGSTDGTDKAATAAGATVVKHGTRQGAGAATRTGFKEALKAGADVVVTLDGDGQHDPDEIPILLEPIKAEKSDFVIGSRFLCDAKAPQYRKLGIGLITWLYNVGHKVKIVDSQSGFRAYTKKALEAINITYRGFGFSIQSLVQARKRKLRITEVPVSCIYNDTGSTEPPLQHGLSVAVAVLEIRLREEVFKGRQ